MEIEKPAVGFFRFFWYSKKRICDAFWDVFATRPPFSCKLRRISPTLTKNYDYVTDTSLPPDTAVSSFSGSGISLFDNGHIMDNIAICWLPHLFLNGASGRRRRVSTDTHWWVKEVSNSSSVDYLTDLSTETRRRLSTDTNRRVTGTGCVYFKSETSIFTY